MLSFKKATPYSFKVEGKPYTLPAVTLDLLDEFNKVIAAPAKEQGQAMLDLLREQADKRTFEAIKKHIPLQKNSEDDLTLEDLFKDWAGMRDAAVTPGESEGSPVQ